MPGSKPCLGYPSRSSAIAAMARDGVTSRQIADAINAETPNDPITLGAVAAAVYSGRAGPALRITLAPDLCERLDGAARGRGVSASQLVHRLLTAVLDDNLINAILDDGEDA